MEAEPADRRGDDGLVGRIALHSRLYRRRLAQPDCPCRHREQQQQQHSQHGGHCHIRQVFLPPALGALIGPGDMRPAAACSARGDGVRAHADSTPPRHSPPARDAAENAGAWWTSAPASARPVSPVADIAHTLDLSGRQLTRSSLHLLPASLTCLDLSRCGLDSLRALASLPHLELLNLSYNRLPAFDDLSQLISLKVASPLPCPTRAVMSNVRPRVRAGALRARQPRLRPRAAPLSQPPPGSTRGD